MEKSDREREMLFLSPLCGAVKKKDMKEKKVLKIVILISVQ